jgi:hypothetical protein
MGNFMASQNQRGEKVQQWGPFEESLLHHMKHTRRWRIVATSALHSSHLACHFVAIIDLLSILLRHIPWEGWEMGYGINGLVSIP